MTWTNTPRKIWALGLPGLAFMAPGDVWDSSDPRLDSERAVEQYMQALNDVVIDPTPPPFEISRIAQAAEQRLA